MSDNPARVPIVFGDRDIQADEEHLSIHVSRTLDNLGYSQYMIKHRVQMYREIQTVYSRVYPSFKVILAGSKCEGLTAPLENDFDVMSTMPDVICADNSLDFIHLRNITIFQTERQDTPAGYTKLKLLKYEGAFSEPFIQNALFHNERGERYASSDFFVEYIKAMFEEYDNNMFCHERSGPSQPISHKIHNTSVDSVYAFKCVCPNILESFLTRPRLNNRPARTILNDITDVDAHVVPVGFKGSETYYQEWRICFTEAELNLIHSFNDVESKLCILLKMISKILKIISNDITSYVMKNIVLWLVELYPDDMFIEQLLIHQIVQALVFLKKCVEANYLPSYMIPERNLLAGKLNPTQRQELTTFLSILMQEGGYVLLRCEKLRVAMTIMYREPGITLEFKWRRDMVEKLCLLTEKYASEIVIKGLPRRYVILVFSTDERYCNVTTLINLVLPELLHLFIQGYSEEVLMALCQERLRLMVS